MCYQRIQSFRHTRTILVKIERKFINRKCIVAACNAHGDVIQLLDADGNLVKTYDYDAYGNELTRDQNDENPFRYCGEYYDTETGFIYLRARYYDPNTGRFISQDPAKDGLNWYEYANDNPVSYIDPLGLSAKKTKTDDEPKDAPGTLYNTMDEAAIGFANYINEKSISENTEYITFIYAKKDKDILDIIFDWLSRVFREIGHHPIEIKEGDENTKYAFVEPSKGTIDESTVPFNVGWWYDKVAEIHTHGAYEPKYKFGNEKFSPVDLEAIYISYLVTPMGTIRKFTPIDGKDIEIYWDAPFDPNCPRRPRR